jgi:hypothetical protein
MPITAAALVPNPPLLVSGVGRDAGGDLDQLRAACRSAVATTLDLVDGLLVVGPAESWGTAAPGTAGSFRPYGPPIEVILPGAGPAREASAARWLDRAVLPSNALAELPLSLAVAAWLLDQEARVRELPQVAAFTIPASLEVARAAAAGRTLAAATGGAGGTSAAMTGAARVGLLVMGDLSARRTPKAPATFHPAAEDFDRRIGDAIRKAELDRLLDLDAALAAELRVGGTAALWLLAGALEGAGALRGEVRYEAAPFGVGYLVGIVELR